MPTLSCTCILWTHAGQTLSASDPPLQPPAPLSCGSRYTCLLHIISYTHTICFHRIHNGANASIELDPAHSYRFQSSCPPAALLMACIRNSASISLLVFCRAHKTGLLSGPSFCTWQQAAIVARNVQKRQSINCNHTCKSSSLACMSFASEGLAAPPGICITVTRIRPGPLSCISLVPAFAAIAHGT